MRLPRNVSGDDLIKALGRLGYTPTRQRGSRVGVSTEQSGRHDVTLSKHDPLRVETLAGILRDVAAHFEVTREGLLERLFD